jgi:hypothetical protein
MFFDAPVCKRSFVATSTVVKAVKIGHFAMVVVETSKKVKKHVPLSTVRQN